MGFKDGMKKAGRMASSQSGQMVGVQQVLELILEEQVKQTALLEQIAGPARMKWAEYAVTGSPPANS
jgi:hypothetical protein